MKPVRAPVLSHPREVARTEVRVGKMGRIAKPDQLLGQIYRPNRIAADCGMRSDRRYKKYIILKHTNHSAFVTRDYGSPPDRLRANIFPAT